MNRTPPLAALLAASLLAPLAAQERRPPRPPRPPIVVRPAPAHTTRVRVVATIEDGVSTTRLEQRIHNPGPRPAEADWVLPLPAGALADEFTMTVDGKPVDGEILPADKARRIYEEIVRRQRDPGLLEYYGQGCLRARIFPVPPKGDVDVVVRYRHVVPATADLHEWRFPLRAVTGLEGAALALDVKIDSRRPIKNAWSPLGGVDVVRDGDHRARASLELPKGSIPTRDLELFWSVREGAIGLDLLTYKKGQDPRGYFMMLLAPQHEWPQPKNVARVVQFVLDTSGSMKGKKIEQAREALRFFVQSLKPGDWFNIVPFSTEARPFFDAPVLVDEDTRAKALQKIAEIEAVGGTNIEEALQTALTGSLPGITDRAVQVVPITVFLTDGQPTIGMTDPGQLTKKIGASNEHGQRVFVFGVGNDVNTRLLDKVAEQSRGDRDYVREDEDIEVKTSALFTKLSHPVMTDLELSVDGVEILDRAPKELPDLFKGSRIVVLGRYRGTGPRAIRLRGRLGGESKELVFEGTFPEADTDRDFVPALWADRRIAVLLENIRLNGESKELVDEVRRLGREFGIVTPFTSHLIVEEGMRVAQARGLDPADTRTRFFDAGDEDRVVDELRRAGEPTGAGAPTLRLRIDSLDSEVAEAEETLEELADAPAAGRAAVDRSVELQRLAKKAEVNSVLGLRDIQSVPTSKLVSRRIGTRTLHLVGGVWVDQRYGAEHRGKERRIEAFSDEYFALLREHPDLAACLAFSARLVVVLDDGTAVEITG